MINIRILAPCIYGCPDNLADAGKSLTSSPGNHIITRLHFMIKSPKHICEETLCRRRFVGIGARNSLTKLISTHLCDVAELFPSRLRLHFWQDRIAKPYRTTLAVWTQQAPLPNNAAYHSFMIAPTKFAAKSLVHFFFKNETDPRCRRLSGTTMFFLQRSMLNPISSNTAFGGCSNSFSPRPRAGIPRQGRRSRAGGYPPVLRCRACW